MKKIIVLILLLSMILTLFACNKTPSEETESESGKVTESESMSQSGSVTETKKETDAKTEQGSTEAPTEPVTEDCGTVTETDTKANTETNETVEGSQSETSTESDNTDATVSGTESGSETESLTQSESESQPRETVSETETKKETEEMESIVLNDGLASVGKYEEYDLDTYMSPIWDGKVIHNETVMFVGPDDKAPLLYDADKIISVRSYDLKTEYVKGVDYDYVDGKLVLLEGTRIPYVPLSTYYSVLDPEKPYLSTMYNGQVTQTMYGDNTTMTQWQVAVTYKHSDTWDGKVVESYEDRYADFIGKLERGEDVTVFFYGDSITTGATSSQSRAPYAPSFARMFVQYVAKQYGYTVKYVESYSDADLTNAKPAGGTTYPDTVFGTNGTITYINNAVGGWSAETGLKNYASYVDKYIREYGCDLFVLAFGMNIPGSGCTASEFTGQLEQIVSKVHEGAPDADVVLVSTMIPNPEAVSNPADTFFCNKNQYTFEEGMYPLAEEINKNGISCAVAPMTSVSQYIHAQKRYRDTTGNNVNHPSDFLARTYAQVIYQTVFGYENYEKAPVAIGETPIVDVNYNAIIGGDAAGEIFLDGKMGTANKNDAMCVRIEKTEGGYFMYYVAKGTKIYVNAAANELAYAMSGETVWTYNATLKSMVCDGSELAIKLVTPEICLHPNVIAESGHGKEACVRCGIEASVVGHNMTQNTVTNTDGSVTYSSSCTDCGYVESSYTVPAGVVYYSGVATSKSPDFYRLNGELKSEGELNFTRVTAQTSDHGHELHWIRQNTDPHTDYAGNLLDTKGNRYLVIKIRASHETVNMTFIYMLYGAASQARCAVPVVKAGKWMTYVLDLKSIHPDYYVELEDGSFTMQRFKMFIGAGFDQIENGYIDFGYMALCKSFADIEKIVDAETVRLINVNGAAPIEIKPDGSGIGDHSLVEDPRG